MPVSRVLPDGPRLPRPLLMLQLMARPLESIDAWAREYGDPFALGRGTGAGVVCGDPRAIQAIMTADPETFEPRRGDKVLRLLLGDNAVQYLVGEPHRRERRLLGPFFRGDAMRAHGETIRAVTEQAMRAWAPRRAFAVRPVMQDVTLRVIAGIVLGRDEGPRVVELRRRLNALLEFTGSWTQSLLLTFLPRTGALPASPWHTLLRHERGIDALVRDEIRARRAPPAAPAPPADVLGALLASSDESGRPLPEVAVRDEVLSLLFAGHETTASALSWALECIHRTPGVRDALQAELDACGRDATPDEIAALPYLTAVCQETLRLYPGIVLVPRTLRRPLEIPGFELAPGTTVMPCMHLTHRRPDLFPEPERFRPERFLERDFEPGEYWPFGMGARHCLGVALAQYEMKIVLATMLARWQLATSGPRSPAARRRGVFAAPPPSLLLVPEFVRSGARQTPGASGHAGRST